MLYVKVEKDYVVDYKWADSLPRGYMPTIYGNSHSVTDEIFSSKLVDGQLVFDKEHYEAKKNAQINQTKVLRTELEDNKPITRKEFYQAINELKALLGGANSD